MSTSGDMRIGMMNLGAFAGSAGEDMGMQGVYPARYSDTGDVGTDTVSVTVYFISAFLFLYLFF
jgi:hypothetical protein